MAVVNPETVPLNTESVLNINMSHVTRLTSSNYLMWSLQVRSFLDGHGLSGHLDAAATVPAATIAGQPNPNFVKWSRQDNLIYSALIGTITVTLQPLVSRTTTASQIWTKLASTYAKPSRGHIKQLKTQLKNFTKGPKSIDEYVQGVTNRLDQLAILGKSYDHEDAIELILDGLPEDYKTVVDQIEGKDTPPSLTEVHERLLNQEAKLLSVVSTTAQHSVFSDLRQQRSTTQQ
ncbi:PREDICTED: uncharacterized protein LOC104784014 [Camelina sativa]|uniref:Uncharacterized protein LOC104784014 n=1 Tax=Camelina sativa TaxID=90675 RepID=A0ABM0YXE7_CAMSA|nr:PREDICTED: uncharacterized protein LOC104784014 [Camelina sativa]